MRAGGEVEMIQIDMPMPKNCGECYFNDGEYGREYYEKCRCTITGNSMTKSNYKCRPKDCPLKEEKQ